MFELKLYLPIVALISIAVIGYEVAAMNKYRPTVDSFKTLDTETGYLRYRREISSSRMPPVVNGRVLACSANFFGPTLYCDERVHHLNDGMHLTVTFAELASSPGWQAKFETRADNGPNLRGS